MDIDLLSDIISALITENTSVNLPGVGTFIKEEAPAVISDRGYTINPPYYRLAFVSRSSPDTLVASRYAEREGIPESEAEAVLNAFLDGLKEVLIRERTVLFPGLGKLRVTRENEFFFVSDDNPDLFPEMFALEPVSIGVRNASADSSSAVRPTPVNFVPTEPAAESAADVPAEKVRATSSPDSEMPAAEPAATEATAAAEPAAATSGRRKRPLLRVLLILLILISVAAGTFVILLNFYPDILDRLLYPDPSDLEIVHIIDSLGAN